MFCDVVPACPPGRLSDMALASGPKLTLITPPPQERGREALPALDLLRASGP